MTYTRIGHAAYHRLHRRVVALALAVEYAAVAALAVAWWLKGR